METRKESFLFPLEDKHPERFLRFHKVVVNGFQPISARVVSCLFCVLYYRCFMENNDKNLRGTQFVIAEAARELLEIMHCAPNLTNYY